MDTIHDVIESSRQDTLGATEQGFLDWLSYNVGIEVQFHSKCYVTERYGIMAYLHDAHWQDYLEDLEWAEKAEKSEKS